jgi:integrase
MPRSVHLALVPPGTEKCTVALPRRKPNAEYRSREHLTEREVERLIEAIKDNRWDYRYATMVLLAFRHSLRASELVDLHWEQADLEHALLHVRRLKNGSPATHPLTGRELRALRRLQRETKSPFDDGDILHGSPLAPFALTFAPGTPLRSDPQRQPLPVAGGEGKAPLPNARRRKG